MNRLRHALVTAANIAVAAIVVITTSVTPFAAAASSVPFEAESMTVQPVSGSAVVRDSIASGGNALVLSRTATASKTLTLPASTRVVVRAKGQQCSGAPAMTVTIDGVKVSTTNVAATKWTDYATPKTIAAGSHTIGISFGNPYRTFFCVRTLSVDAVTLIQDATPTTTPTTPTTTPTTSPAPEPGTVAPKANLPGWTHLFADDFDRPAAVGSWASASDPDKIVYVGAQGQQWRAYPATYTDTYQHRPYRSDQVLSVANGMLTFDLHNVDGQPAGANPSPILANGSQYQTYGRYSARLRVDSPDLSEYHIAWLLWPQSEKWPQDGEEDFPEGALNGTAKAFHHYARSSGGQETVDTGAKFTDWHTYTIEWSPGRMRFLLDDAVVLESTNHVPSKPMRWQLQTETNGSGSHRGRLLVDWVSVWSRSAPL